MQNRTINNALLALWRSGEAREHVEAIMALRGVEKPVRVHDRPLSRGGCRRIVMDCLPCTTAEAGDVIQARVDGITRKAANNRAYCALVRLEDQSAVVRVSGVWRLAP